MQNTEQTCGILSERSVLPLLKHTPSISSSAVLQIGDISLENKNWTAGNMFSSEKNKNKKQTLNIKIKKASNPVCKIHDIQTYLSQAAHNYL